MLVRLTLENFEDALFCDQSEPCYFWFLETSKYQMVSTGFPLGLETLEI